METLQSQHAVDRATDFAGLSRSPRLRALGQFAAAQQPEWAGHPDLACIRAELADLPALVSYPDVQEFRAGLARAGSAGTLLLHAGECAELFSMATPGHVALRLSVYRDLASRLASRTGRPVILLARMAGQHAKPRSQPLEVLPGGSEIPVYRGDAVNSREPAAAARRADPWRLLTSYDRSRDTLGYAGAPAGTGQPAFVSHEALLRDYEEPMTKGRDRLYSGSGHLLWIGERTRAVGGWHIQWASLIANPVGVKLGPATTPHDLACLLHALNPRREPGRLSLISRLGAAATRTSLEPLARTAAECRMPVLWQCDPMHGNTRKLGNRKVRLLPDLRDEISAFVRCLRQAGCEPGGLHLEVTPADVQECYEDMPSAVSHRCDDPPCDPRLNRGQAMAMIDHFAEELSR
jgi:3-deoxy-7-phosphoheptulonate synthase